MGNLISLDMGLVVLRCTIFDKNNTLAQIIANHKPTPSSQQPSPPEESKTLSTNHQEEESKSVPTNNAFSPNGFDHSLTFYSEAFKGTFYFLQFNVLKSDQVGIFYLNFAVLQFQGL